MYPYLSMRLHKSDQQPLDLRLPHVRSMFMSNPSFRPSRPKMPRQLGGVTGVLPAREPPKAAVMITAMVAVQ